MRRSVRLSFEIGGCALAVVLLAAGCTGGRRRGAVTPPTDAGTSDGNVVHEDLGPPPDGYVPPVPVCGDWNIDEGEQCDDGNRTSGDGCDSSCQLETPASCGDYTINALAGETCDDGNGYGSDGCSASCTVETGWTCGGEPSACTRAGGGTIDRSATPGLAIPDASTTGVTSTLSLTGSPATTCSIGSITVDLDITHTYIGDLTVTLTSPSGTPVVLHSRSGGSTDNIVGNYPTTLTPYGLFSDFTGELAAGTWTLKVVDGSGSDTGTLNSWGLHITCGTAP